MSGDSEYLCKFSSDLYGQVVQSKEVSIYAAMAVTMAGSKGSTRAQMLKAMNLREAMSDEEVHKLLGPILTDYFTSSEGVDVSLANRLYVQKTASIVPAYKDCVKKYYKADSEQVDFAGQPEEVCDVINKWVAEKTEGKILNLLSPYSISPDRIVMIINTVYFKGKWKMPFDKSQTKRGDFTKLDGTKKGIQLMFVNGSFTVMKLKEEEAEVIKIPFRKSKWSMLIILPNEHNGLQKVIAGLQQTRRLEQILQSRFQHAEVDLYLPRFKLTEDTDTDAVPLLQAMGVKDLFSPNAADLTGICKTGKLCISYMRHKAILEVDEEGVTAVAVTEDAVDCMPAQFTVNRPFFVALIYDNKVPVFIGHVTDPEEN